MQIFTLTATFVCILTTHAAFAQGIPSAVSILPTQTSGAKKDQEPETESPRYEKRVVAPRRVLLPPKREVPSQSAVQPDADISKPMDQATTMSGIAPAPGSEEAGADEDGNGPSVGDELRDLVIGASPAGLTRYQSFLAPDDIRRNRVELEIAPSFIYNESKSEHWVRSYNSATPAGRVGLNVWFTPFFGVSTSYQKTFLGTIQKQFNSTSQTPFMDQWLQIGLRFRRFTSHSQLAPGMTFGVDFYDYQRKLPADDVSRNKLSTNGMLLSVETRLPQSESYAWILKLDYMPIIQHRELPLGRDVRSGDRAESFYAGVSVGPEFKLNRTNRLFFRGRVQYEKDSFSGRANTSDPQTGQTPENVSVVNTFTIFEMGYIWGD